MMEQETAWELNSANLDDENRDRIASPGTD